MCTVSFIPVNNKIIITSNRDEKHWRSPAMAPKSYPLSTGNILFPRDADAGGTWIALHENGNAIIFLNGAFEKHEPRPPYKKSRGVILLDLINQENPYQYFLQIDLDQIEPFTAIIFDDEKLFECRWDGQKKYDVELDAHQPHIWSSVTLYDESVISKRKKWFEEWMRTSRFPSQNEVLHFHEFGGDGDQHNDFKMNRDGIVYTVSITSIELSDQTALMKYVDLKNHQEADHKLSIKKVMTAK